MTFAARLQFKLGKGLTTDAEALQGQFDGREITLKPQLAGETLRTTKFYILTAPGFSTPEAAEAFGRRLQRGLAISGLLANVGVNVGEDKQTLFMAPSFLRAAFPDHAGEFRFPIWGLEVYDETRDPKWVYFGAEATVSGDPDQFLAAIDAQSARVDALSETLVQALQLLNAAVMAPNPAAQLVLGIAAIELLAKTEAWSPAQKAAVKRYKAMALEDKALAAEEREEVAAAIERIYKIGVLEASRRFIRSVCREDLLDEWQAIYKLRSQIFHGLSAFKADDVSLLAARTLPIATALVTAAVELAQAGPEEN
ncbi:hypothetical protein [Caulobacter sp.]|uniref:hypothetical protein n=1 Tax=Caulobacter sp. TaxID=78 RepID=UPI001B00A61D|nr:hypothetical protein [Caulobacter sp.]MBO9547112.1 hypothetical protein [Caulobacter sp.]